MALSIEDIMCDQRIFFADDNNQEYQHDLHDNYLIVRLRNINPQNVIKNLKNNFTSFLISNFTLFQRIPSLILVSSNNNDIHHRQIKVLNNNEEVPERCVKCIVLYEPRPEQHIGDIVFIHGLHGGIDRTWIQGTWRQSKQLFSPCKQSNDNNLMYIRSNDTTKTESLWKIYSKVRRKNNDKQLVDKDTKNQEYDTKIDNDEEENLNNNNNNNNISYCWPQDWLPQDCPGMRVLAINYTTDVLWRPMWQKKRARSDLKERSKEMIDQLLRLNLGNKPIIWVGHSKGGLFIKQILLHAWHADNTNELRNIFIQTKGIMFYSVPHKGSPIADIIFPFFKRSIELLELQRNCEFVLNLHKQFLDILNNTTNHNNKPEIFSFIDTENTPVAFTSFQFIAYESADPDIGMKCIVPLNHREICKPAGRDCFLYLELVKLIKRTIEKR